MVDGQNISNEKTSNGTGKSTIFKSIIYGLGILQRVPKNLVSKGKENGVIALEISTNEDSNQETIVIKRQLSSTKSTSQDLYVSVNGQELKFQRNEYFKAFFEDKILGCPIDIYKYLKIFTQDSPTFLRLNNSDIIKIFEKIFKIDKLDIYYTKQTQELQNIDKELSKLEVYNIKELQEIETLKKSMLKNNQTGDIEDKIQQIDKEIDNIRRQFISDTEIQIKQQEMKSLEQSNSELKTNTIQLTGENSNIEKEIKKFEGLVSNQICPTCLRKTDDVNFKDSVQVLTEQKTIIIKKNKEMLLILQSKRGGLEQKYIELKTELNNIQQNKVIYDQKQKHKISMESMLNNLVSQNKNSIELKIKEREELILSYKEQIKLLTIKKDTYTYLCQIFSTKSIVRQNLLMDILNNGLKQLLSFYSTYIFQNSRIDFYFDDNVFNIGILIEQDNIFKEYEILSQGERKKLEVVFILQMNDLITSFYGLNMNLFIFDEFLDNLDYHSTNQILELLSMYQTNNKQMMFITSHKPDINLSNCTIINIEKENEVSTIQSVTNL